MPLYEYKCMACSAVKEEFRSLQDRMLPAACNECGGSMPRTVSTPTIKLEGITGHFPTAYDKWEKVHVEGTKIARRRSGEYD